MIRNFKLVKVDYKYCDYLRQFDSRVSYNKGRKELRPFVGILFNVGDIEYFAPLSSPKEKHISMTNSIDMIKIKNGTLGVVNFNNMIPVTLKNYEILNLKEIPTKVDDAKWYILLRTQLKWLNKNIEVVSEKAFKLYDMYKNDKLPSRVKNRCCDFTLLEEKCKLYNE